MVVPIVCVTATVVVQVEEREAVDIRRNGRTPQCVVVRSLWDGIAAAGGMRVRVRDGGEDGEGAAGRLGGLVGGLRPRLGGRYGDGPATATMRVVGVMEMRVQAHGAVERSSRWRRVRKIDDIVHVILRGDAEEI